MALTIHYMATCYSGPFGPSIYGGQSFLWGGMQEAGKASEKQGSTGLLVCWLPCFSGGYMSGIPALIVSVGLPQLMTPLLPSGKSFNSESSAFLYITCAYPVSNTNTVAGDLFLDFLEEKKMSSNLIFSHPPFRGHGRVRKGVKQITMCYSILYKLSQAGPSPPKSSMKHSFFVFWWGCIFRTAWCHDIYH